MRNLKMIIGYDGTDFSGWQVQPGFRTVQEVLETAIQEITQHRPRANASGRTDAGVHAVGQVANFFTPSKIPAERLLIAVNSRLPEDVVVKSCEDAEQGFDANKDAIRKLYRYVIRDNRIPDPFLRRYYATCPNKLDVEIMNRAAQILLGRHDFHSFETDWPNRMTSIRTITHIRVNRAGDYVWIDVEADGFLYNMVRTIAGTLMNIGRGYWPEKQMQTILQAEDRTVAGPTAPATGLFLMRVTYA